jgi:hypothetical protein
MKIPNFNIQAPEKLQISSLKSALVDLDFGTWNFSGAWMLVLGAS